MTYSIRKRQRLKKLFSLLLAINIFSLIFLIGRQATTTFLIQKPQEIIHPFSNLEEKITEELKKRGFNQKADILIQPNVIILKMNQQEILLSKTKNIPEQIEILQIIINQDKIKGRKAKTIDLRYKNPVVRY